MNDAIFKHIRAHYADLKGYSSAGMEAGKDASKIYLNANENPHPLPGLEGLNRYPEPQPPALLEAFAQNYSPNGTIDAGQIAITRGADEALSLLTQVFCEPHQDNILINAPTFGMYAVNALSMPAGVITVPLVKQDDTFTLDHQAIITAAADPAQNVKLVYLCSPNNPTGDSFSHDEISDLCDALDGHAVVVLDETYAEFSSAGSMVDDLGGTPNLIILRTLSKSYAFAGMRIGCMICADEDFIQLVKTKVIDAYPLPRLSIEAAFHVLSPDIKEIAVANIQKILAERTRVEKRLGASDKIKKVYKSDANYLLFEMDNAAEFCKFCTENNVIIRDFSGKDETKDCLRLSIGLPEENDMVLSLLLKF